jgi:hypothetical protein
MTKQEAFLAWLQDQPIKYGDSPLADDAFDVWKAACAWRDAQWKDAIHFYDGDMPDVAFDLDKTRNLFT